MSASARNKPGKIKTCLERIQADTGMLFDELGVTDTLLEWELKLAGFKLELDSMYEKKADERIAFLKRVQEARREIESIDMVSEDLRSQYRELEDRLKIMIPLFSRIQPRQQQQLINLAKKMDSDNKFDEMNEGIAVLDITMGAGEELKNFKNYLKTQAANAAQMAADTVGFISGNARAGLIYLLAFICLLPCKDVIVEALREKYPNLANLVSDPFCAYWKIEALKLLKIKYDNLTPADVDGILWASLGVTARATEVCSDVCIYLYDRIKSMMGITRTGISNILFRTGQGVSSMFNLTGMDKYGRLSPPSSPKDDSVASSSIDSFLTAATDISDNYKNPLTVLEAKEFLSRELKKYFLDAMSEATQLGSQDTMEESDDGKLSIMPPMGVGLINASSSQNSTVYSPTSEKEFFIPKGRGTKALQNLPFRDPMDTFMAEKESSEGKSKIKRKGEESGVISDFNEDITKRQELKANNEFAGGRGRKSRRHKKRKSTLKRRRIKRRRTRKGKKRRHTRKH